MAVPLKRGAKATEKLHPILAEQPPGPQEHNNNLRQVTHAIESEATKHLTSRTAALSLQSENEASTSKLVPQKVAQDTGGDQGQFLPPIK